MVGRIIRSAAWRLGFRIERRSHTGQKRLPGVDQVDQEIIEAVRPYTMTSSARLHALILATRYVARSLSGSIVECGVWRGGSMMAVALTLLDEGNADNDLYLFDTFSGMTPPTQEDSRHDGQLASSILDTASDTSNYWAIASLAEVQSAMESTGYPVDRMNFVEGPVEETVPERAPSNIALLRLDTDWYTSTKHELDHLYERLTPGGVLIVDDYGHWLGARQAVDEFFQGRPPSLLIPADEGRLMLKPVGE